VPPATALPPAAPEELVAIGDLPQWAQPAFPGYKALNRIQSRIYGAAFNRWGAYACVCVGGGRGWCGCLQARAAPLPTAYNFAACGTFR
jgi:pre-mRNA-splicing helicase BRR2